MTPSKKKLLKPKVVSLDPSLKVETPIDELQNDENKLFENASWLRYHHGHFGQSKEIILASWPIRKVSCAM